MVGVVVVTHGGLAEELIRTATLVLGPLEQVVGVGLAPTASVDELSGQLRRAIASVDRGDGVLILVDMFGGTPSNLSLAMGQEGKIEVLTGVNLPMLLKVGNSRHQGLKEVSQAVREAGTRSILLASELLKGR